ncbi:DUF5017 domain-containing protein [Longitalea luteola]|uniref:DUF5017 domain-containing protein n=1 Tax=Longitalea luteola TaxID=2812563 RepID=UPI001A9717A5|nr:DUF5017 domain-containing protein [Longitalea luteola]
MQKIFIIAISLLLGVACNKKTVDATGFSVTTDKETYSTVDTVRFSFTGNPWYLTFYSGEPYHKYEYSERVTADGIPQLQFTSQMTTGTQTNTLRLMVSTDFSGVYDSTNIYEATWTDITNKAVLATNNTATPSGTIDLAPFITSDHPVYIAFKYTGAAGSAQRTWTIRSVNLSNVLADNTSYALLAISESTAGFKSVAMKAPGVAWTISTSQLQIKGGTTAASAEAEGWVISKPLVLNKVTPDTGTPLKNMTTFMPGYNYIYETPGIYKATFVADNINRYDHKGDVQELNITVQ